MLDVDPVALAGVIILLVVSLGGFTRWLLNRMSTNRDLALANEKELAAYKLHVAETYTTKSGMHEQTQQVMLAIRDVGTDVEQLNQRIDRILERTPAPHTAAPQQ